jgi:hypothetical protein
MRNLQAHGSASTGTRDVPSTSTATGVSMPWLGRVLQASQASMRPKAATTKRCPLLISLLLRLYAPVQEIINTVRSGVLA